MCSINGVSLKNVRDFSDHENLAVFQGDVYIDGKFAGTWSQDFHGGDDVFHFDTNELSKRAKKFSEGVPVHKDIFEILDCFIYCVLQLQWDEDFFKELVTTSSKSIAIINKDNNRLSAVVGKESLTEKDLQRHEAFAERKDYRIYESLNDFHIIVDKDNPAPLFFYERVM